MGGRISVKDLKVRDVFEYQHPMGGSVIGVIARTYESGGKKGAAYIGVFEDGTQIQAHLREGNIQELLWRAEEKAK